jgi:hypothetical protein
VPGLWVWLSSSHVRHVQGRDWSQCQDSSLDLWWNMLFSNWIITESKLNRRKQLCDRTKWKEATEGKVRLRISEMWKFPKLLSFSKMVTEKEVKGWLRSHRWCSGKEIHIFCTFLGYKVDCFDSPLRKFPAAFWPLTLYSSGEHWLFTLGNIILVRCRSFLNDPRLAKGHSVQCCLQGFRPKGLKKKNFF